MCPLSEVHSEAGDTTKNKIVDKSSQNMSQAITKYRASISTENLASELR